MTSETDRGWWPRAGDLLKAAALGAGANFPWELAQSWLYRGVPGFTWDRHLSCCALASLVDGLGVGVLFAAGALAFRDPCWTGVPACGPRSSARLAFTALLGLAVAVGVEQLALRLDWWGYGPSMPRLPGTNLGLTPLAQFVILPPFVLFWLLPRCAVRRDPGRADAPPPAHNTEDVGNQRR